MGFRGPKPTNSPYLLPREEGFQLFPFSLPEPGMLQSYLMGKEQKITVVYGVSDLLAPSSGLPTQENVIFLVWGDGCLLLNP